MAHSSRRTLVVILLATLVLTGAFLWRFPAIVHVSGQEFVATPAPEHEPATVSVVGEGRIAVSPDTAAFVAGVDVMRPTLSEAQAVATEQMTAVIETLVSNGVAEEDIQTVTYRVEVIQGGGPTPPEPVAVRPEPAVAAAAATPEMIQIQDFRVVNQVRVHVRDADRLGELLDTVVAEGANAIGGIQFSVADTAEAMVRARAEAVREARRAAEDLADAAGLRLGEVLTMSEEGGSSPGVAEVAEAAGGGVPIQAGLVEIATSVRVTYTLEPAT